MSIFGNFSSMSNMANNVPKHIQGVTCDVRNCVYHDEDNYCTADRISVGHSYATSSTETICATFKEKKVK